MPYLKFKSEEDRNAAYHLESDLTAHQYDGTIQGLIATIKDENLGYIRFYSADSPYLEAFNQAKIKYDLISKEQIKSSENNYIRVLKLYYPEYAQEL